ncbi:hypothetical protein L6272_00160 [Microgenomates group bacterium]|nr:hypothetical protein [Microgenomates group bacterium]
MTALFKKKTIIAPEVKEEAEKPVVLKSLLKWEAAVRPFKKRDREYYTTIAAIVFLLAVILLFLKEWLLIAVIVALMFVAYVLATVVPEKTEHEITSRGVLTGGKAYKWGELKRFWFSTKWSDTILNVETNLKFPGRLMMLLGEVKEEKIKELLQKQVQYEVPEETFMDRSAKWLSDKIPLEKE